MVQYFIYKIWLYFLIYKSLPQLYKLGYYHHTTDEKTEAQSLSDKFKPQLVTELQLDPKCISVKVLFFTPWYNGTEQILVSTEWINHSIQQNKWLPKESKCLA